jgi:hypothetical protein
MDNIQVDICSNFVDVSGITSALNQKIDTVGAAAVKSIISQYDLSGSKVFIIYGEMRDLTEFFDSYIGIDPINSVWMEGNMEWFNDIKLHFPYMIRDENLHYGIISAVDEYENDDLYTIDSFIFENNIIASTLNVWYIGKFAYTEVVLKSASKNIKYATIVFIESIKDNSMNVTTHNATEVDAIMNGYGLVRAFSNYTYDMYIRPLSS